MRDIHCHVSENITMLVPNSIEIKDLYSNYQSKEWSLNSEEINWGYLILIFLQGDYK